MADQASDKPTGSLLETMVSYSGEGAQAFATFDVALFRELNGEFADKPVVPAPRVHDTSYTTSIGQRRAEMLHRKIGLDGLRVLEIGCGDGMLSRVLAGERGCEVVGVDVSSYPSWDRPSQGALKQIVHDVSARDNEALGLFDRVVSFAVFEHVIHPYNALAAAFDMLKPGGKAYIYANLYRGAKASHRYREVFFPWPHLLFQASVWRDFYRELKGEPMQAAWVNKLTYDQYVSMAARIGFRVAGHFPSAPYFDEAFYQRFEYELSAYPRFDLMHDFIHLVLEKPGETQKKPPVAPASVGRPPNPESPSDAFWRKAGSENPEWLGYRERWNASRRDGASALADAQPWVTFAAIDFLDDVLGKDSRVFEWGSGGSTVFFAERAGAVRSVEHDSGWRDAARDRLSALPNAGCELITPKSRPPSSDKYASGARNCAGLDFETYVNAIRSEPDGSFDVVLVDGRARMGCLEEALPKVAAGGWLVLDNSDYPRYAARLAELRAGPLRDWREVALAGPGPYSRTHAWTTTAWRKPECVKIEPCVAKDLRVKLAIAPLRSYDLIVHLRFLEDPDLLAQTANSFVTTQRVDVAGREYDLADDDLWTGLDLTRSERLFLQSWHPVEPLLCRNDAQTHALAPLIRFALGWTARFGDQALDVSSSGPEGGANDFVGADTALASRFYRLAYLVCAIAPSTDVPDEEFAALVGALETHGRALTKDENFSRQSNHGVLQAMAEICGAARFETLQADGPAGDFIRTMAELGELGRKRLAEMLPTQVGADGSHLEHSPLYQRIIVAGFDWLLGQGLVADDAFRDLVGRMRDCLAWMVDANGRPANLGDTDLGPFKWTAPDAAPADVADKAFADGGYWFVKGPSVYLAQTASFHSRAHKQADAGSFLWRDRGVDILVDPGRYGYVGRTAPEEPAFRDGFWYADERRRYVESTRAHNTLSIDGLNHPRFRSAPTGSGVIATARCDDVFASETTIANLPRITHFRIVVLNPGSWLLCLDGVRARDGMDHDAAQHFCLHPQWTPSTIASESTKFDHSSGLDLHVTPVFAGAALADVARGRGDPARDSWQDLAGWWSPKHMAFEPCASFSVTTRGQSMVMATLCTFEPAAIDDGYCSFNITQRQIRIRWRSGEQDRGLIITRDGETAASTRLRELKVL